ncbi:MAG: serine/threonine-protein kinase [Acidobacteriota bacterium]
MPPDRAGIDPARWQRVEEVFQAALDLECDARERMLFETCAGDDALRHEVQSLLQAYVSAGDRMGDAIRDTALHVVSSGELSEGQHVGAYRILKRLARGGMGAVYLAERADGLYDAQVAIKVIRPEYATSEPLWNRFRAEQRILATLVHPNIARMLDAGITEQRAPYVVMEYVDGEVLNRFCRKHELNLRERLELFRKVCGAVSYAHRNLVIHRDIKPPNILVTPDGTPKLLDFGIAKLLEEEQGDTPTGLTRAGERLMTPEYASPEAIRGEPATTLVDVFALGVVLYELMSGLHPFMREHQSQWELEQTIVSDEAPPPSSVASGPLASAGRHDRADLDAIAAMAMRKDSAERYASVEALSEDVRRWLAGEPVEAAKQSNWYALTKFVRRNKLSVGAGAVLFVLLAAVAVGMSLLAARVTREREAALRERTRAQQISLFLRSMFENADPCLSDGKKLSARDLMDLGAERMRKELATQPDVQSELLETMGTAYKNLGEYARSEAMMQAEMAAQERAFGKDSPEQINTLRQLADVYRLRGRHADAEQALRHALAIQQKTLTPNDPRMAHTLNNLGLVVQSQGKSGEAERMFRRAVAIASLDPDPKQAREVLTMKSNLGQALADNGKDTESTALLREVLEQRQQMLGPDHPQVGRSMYRLANQLRRENQLDEAEKLVRGAMAQGRRVLGETHPDVFNYRNLLATILQAKGERAAAESEYTSVIDGATARLGPNHSDVVFYRMSLASLWEQTGRLRQAETVYRQSLEVLQRTLGEEAPRTQLAMAGVYRVSAARKKIKAAR